MKKINGTRFMSQEEFAKQLVELNMDDEQYETGGIPLMVRGRKIYVDAGDSHTMIYGATGSKKTRMFAMPSIGIFARAGESFVVTDPKGELYKRTAGDVQKQGYEICCLNLRSFREGQTWNPLWLPYKLYHGGERTKAIELVSEMARMIIESEAVEDKFWTTTAIDIFIGLALMLFEEAEVESCNLWKLAEIWNDYLAERKKFLKKLKEDYRNTLIGQKLSYLNNNAERTVGSMEAFISMGLNKLSVNESFMQFLSMPGLDITKLTEGKVAIYLVIPDENKSYHFVASLFLEQLYEVLIQKAQTMEKKELPIRMNFLIDEFANIPKIENMEAMITAARSRNIRFHLIVQGMKQLRQKYKEGAEIISGNCNNWVYLYSKEFQLLQDISNLCGEVIYEGNLRMPLFSEFDLQHLNKELGEALVLAGRNCPCLTNLADINEYPYPELVPENLDLPDWESFSMEKEIIPERHRVCIEAAESKFFRECQWTDEDEDMKWLIAAGPKDMILAEALVSNKELISGAAIAGMGAELAKKAIDVRQIRWYYFGGYAARGYHRILESEPEKTYLTLDELGIDFMYEDVDECKGFFEQRELPEEIKGQITLSKVYEDGREEVLLEKEITCYGEGIGLHYNYNVAFREANTFLKGTEYEKAYWTEKEGKEQNQVAMEKRMGDEAVVLTLSFSF